MRTEGGCCGVCFDWFVREVEESDDQVGETEADVSYGAFVGFGGSGLFVGFERAGGGEVWGELWESEDGFGGGDA